MATIYYVEDDEQRGPVSLAELDALKQTGTVEDATLVWQDGMEDWIPFRKALPVLKGASRAEPAEALATATATTADKSNPFLAAAKSGESFSPNDKAGPAVADPDEASAAVEKAGVIKPETAFEAKMAARRPVPASIGGRIAAYVIDSFVITIGFVAVVFLAAMLFSESDMLFVVAFILGMVWMVAYDANIWGADPCRTLGKRLMGMKVEKADGTALTSGGAIGRTLVKLTMLSVVSPLICFIVVLCDSQKRSVQDFALGTVVVNEFS